MTFQYYDQPFCRPKGDKLKHKPETLGEVVDGNRCDVTWFQNVKQTGLFQNCLSKGLKILCVILCIQLLLQLVEFYKSTPLFEHAHSL